MKYNLNIRKESYKLPFETKYSSSNTGQKGQPNQTKLTLTQEISDNNTNFV